MAGARNHRQRTRSAIYPALTIVCAMLVADPVRISETGFGGPGVAEQRASP
jgi:hypothetical protein